MKRLLALTVVLAAAMSANAPSEAQAANTHLQRTYEVQVEYWFFDTDYSYWRTVFATDSEQDAQLMYDLLLNAKQNGQLNSVVPNEYWRYIAVDVRLVVKYKYNYYQQDRYLIKPAIQRQPLSSTRTDLKLAP